MSNEDGSIDAGLDELTTDILGPADGAQAPSETPPEAVPQESAQAQPAETESAEAPTPPAAPATIEVDGKHLTLDQVKAALTTREQFPHLQSKYLQAKTRLEELERAEAARAAAQQPAKFDGKQVQAQIRTNFDPMVKQAVEELGLEADFPELYPGWAAQMMMFRDVVTATVNRVNYGLQELEQYKQQAAQSDTASQNERIIADARNHIASLAGYHEALAPLAKPEVVDAFWSFLETRVDPSVDKLFDREFLISQWVAFNKDSYLQRATTATAAQTAAAKARADGKRLVAGVALPGTRPAAPPPAPATALDEMVADHFSRQ